MKGCLTLAASGLFACGGPAAKPDYPSLDPDPSQSAQAKTTDIPEAPPPDPAEFAAPPSNPTGPPIAITWSVPAVGDKRTRDISHLALYSSAWDTDSRRQRTTRHFRVVERVAKVEDHRPTEIEAAFEDGKETVDLDSGGFPQTLVSGDYLVTVRADGASVSVTRADSGFPIGDREREEIQDIYGGEIGRDAPLVTVLKGRTLRVGETVELTAEESGIAGGGDALKVPIHLTLDTLVDGVATFNFRFYSDEATASPSQGAGNDVRGVRLSFGVEVATGRMRTVGIVDARAENSPKMKSTSRMVEDTTITY